MRRRPLLAVAVPALILLAALTTVVVTRWAPLLRFDTSVSARARGYGDAHPGWVGLMRVAADTATGPVVFAVGLAVAVGLLLLRRYQDLAVLVAAATATHLVQPALGHAVGRARPVDGFVHYDLPSYPSAHTVHAATAALLGLLLLWPHLRPWPRRAVAAGAVGWVGLIALTRVALLAHWPTDVLGGLLVVLGVAPLAVLAVPATRPFRSRPAPPGQVVQPGAGPAGVRRRRG